MQKTSKGLERSIRKEERRSTANSAHPKGGRFLTKEDYLVDPLMDDPQWGKGKKSKSSKMPSRKSATKVKVSLMLTEDVDFRLTVHAAALRTDRSALANQLLDSGLKRFVVQDRGRPEEGEEGRAEDAA